MEITTKRKWEIKKSLEVLEKLWLENSELRLAQLILNLMGQKEGNPGLYYVEDDKLIKSLIEYYK